MKKGWEKWYKLGYSQFFELKKATNPYEGRTVGIFEADAEPLWFEN